MPTIQVYLQEDVYKQLTEKVSAGERSTLINKLLREHFSKEEENEMERD